MTVTDYEIDILDETEKLHDDALQLIRDVLFSAMKAEDIPMGTEVSVSIVTDGRIQELNRDYREKDRPTDVLSFALHDGEEQIIAPTIPDMLGDIIISLPAVYRQSDEYGHSFERELAFLTVHGFLHLCGYDHENEADEQKMFARQEELLTAYGIQK
ncbi:rRNA maturation RNase YbeY [Salisediminibacterium selenitireducens]|uniref:Endoribonuclease YbeY n=1 Tax=Bacillus selenitireducens (strain ATCC 700615 / DSM 15326 / MLS10) TaxID=439292 RepID=D6XWA5_BACIE|nr:rRNA maturation RNase YbeY [Salisediminibacterium selenitireducens]ADH99859.1 protein of unknown function UPF0054 [[Bacillus] selenitireducens MLS10]